jgi:hypothetical protein
MIVKLSDILGFEDKAIHSLPREELEAALRRHFAFLPNSATIAAEGETVTITLPDTMEADALEAQRLFQHWQSRQGNLGPGDEYTLVDEFADLLGLRDWYEWRPDTGASAASANRSAEGGKARCQN